MTDQRNMTVSKSTFETALLSLTKEAWVLMDRVMMLEDLLDQKGVISKQDIKTYLPSKTRQAEIDEACQKVLQSVLSSMDF